MMFHGIDEAALGPRLGPFCAALISFGGLQDYTLTMDLYDLLSPSVIRNRDNPKSTAAEWDQVIIADSKKIYNPSRGIADLETVIWSVLESCDMPCPDNLLAWVQEYCLSYDFKHIQDVPWFEEAGESRLPLSELSLNTVSGKASRLKAELKNTGLTLSAPLLRLVCVRSFNAEIIRQSGKSAAIQSILRPLMKTALNHREFSSSRLSVDHQGARRYYGDWLTDLAPGAAISILEEIHDRSAYQITLSSDPLNSLLHKEIFVEFLVSGDSQRLEIALASMFAKYFREIAMHYFNSWWLNRVDNLRPTAGYPQDARRFLEHLEVSGKMPECRDDLIRLS